MHPILARILVEWRERRLSCSRFADLNWISKRNLALTRGDCHHHYLIAAIRYQQLRSLTYFVRYDGQAAGPHLLDCDRPFSGA
jgi:hypothetical protein